MSLLQHVRGPADLGELRHVTTRWNHGGEGGFSIEVLSRGVHPWSWATIPPPADGWELCRQAAIEAEIVNRGTAAVEVAVWVVGNRGWDASGDFRRLEPGARRRFRCDLRRRFPDGTPAIDPRRVGGVRVMLAKAPEAATIDVVSLVASGTAPQWQPVSGRLEIPAVEETAPGPGRRVRYRLPGDEESGIHCLLYLPTDWRPGHRYPVIVEYPGNIHFVPGCYSTGRPDQCVIGYGMSGGVGSIWVSLPFVDRAADAIVENGWGTPDDSAAYCVDMVEHVCGRFGGDRDRIVLTGFSRGAIACGFIGLRHDRIASLWSGLHPCQHFDGDGWGGADMAGAVERARRFRGRSIFHTDNSEEKVRPVTEALSVPSTFVSSGLGAHAAAMFLDDRPSTLQVRRWYADLVGDGTGAEGR